MISSECIGNDKDDIHFLAPRGRKSTFFEGDRWVQIILSRTQVFLIKFSQLMKTKSCRVLRVSNHNRPGCFSQSIELASQAFWEKHGYAPHDRACQQQVNWRCVTDQRGG